MPQGRPYTEFKNAISLDANELNTARVQSLSSNQRVYREHTVSTILLRSSRVFGFRNSPRPLACNPRSTRPSDKPSTATRYSPIAMRYPQSPQMKHSDFTRAHAQVSLPPRQRPQAQNTLSHTNHPVPTPFIMIAYCSGPWAAREQCDVHLRFTLHRARPSSDTVGLTPYEQVFHPQHSS